MPERSKRRDNLQWNEMTSCFTKMPLQAEGHTRTVGPAERPSEAAEHLPHRYRRSDNGVMEECHRVCAQACVTLCASTHTRAFKGKHSPSRQCAHICKCPLPSASHADTRACTKYPLNACTHTQVQHRTPLSLWVQWPRWKENKHANGFTLLERCIWIPPVIFVSLPFAFFLSPLLDASARRGPPWLPESATHDIRALPRKPY